MIASISDPLLPAGWLLVAGCWLAGLPATGYRGELAGLLACWLAMERARVGWLAWLAVLVAWLVAWVAGWRVSRQLAGGE